MGKLAWYFNRLRAMNLPEVGWRLQQKNIQRLEKSRFSHPIRVDESLFNASFSSLSFHPEYLGIQFQNRDSRLHTSIHLLGGFRYEDFKEKWQAGFQTPQSWPNTFSYALNYKQRDDIGDARTNWELNRHFQFALLAKAYYCTRDERYLQELTSLVDDWCAKNPFLHGISWTSVMEVAIRSIQWCVALAFLKISKAGADLQSRLQVGILNMVEYIALHYSRFSSANNHLLVEATAIAYAGYAFDYMPWKALAQRILDEELLKQNYEDGVNMEMALHYQTFGMEAYALVMHLMQLNGDRVPEVWMRILNRQCEFVTCSMVDDVSACEFGDNDEGKILDLEGGEISHYRYLLQLCSLVTDRRYEAFDEVSETIRWLFDREDVDRMPGRTLERPTGSRLFPQGGYSFLRSRDNRVVIGIDHAPLGFGSIAAHGHADALSFQLYVDGKCILGDPGTYIYHCNLPKRNEYRRACNHNTVWTPMSEQSQMMGAFLWGKKTETKVLEHDFSDAVDRLKAECVWHNGCRHTREFVFDKERSLDVNDCFQSPEAGFASFILHPECEVSIQGNVAKIRREEIEVNITYDATPRIGKAWYSTEYGREVESKKLVVALTNNELNTKIWIEKF